jgi:alpha-glucosidase (family GH31 glycosyl hydrolase)
MAIKITHMPGGLFPHFDSGIERRPYFVRVGESVSFGCRVEGGGGEAPVLKLSSGKGEETITGTFVSENGRGERYFRFDLARAETDFTYSFEIPNLLHGKKYFCPVLTEERPLPERLGDGWIYHIGERAYRLRLSSTDCIMLDIAENFTVKVEENMEDSKLFSEADGAICLQRGGVPVLRIQPQIALLTDYSGDVYGLKLTVEFAGSAFYGLGEKFDSVNQRKKKPLNYVVEQFSHQEDKAYLPIPFMFSDGGAGLFAHGTYPSRFDLTGTARDGWMCAEIFAVTPQEGTLFKAELFVGEPREIISSYTGSTGKPVLPPKWAFGPWMSSNGWNTQREAAQQIEYMNETGIPATVMVLEAWSDEETFYIWNGAEYEPKSDGSAFAYKDFTFPQEGPWPNPKEFCALLEKNGIKLVLWQIPVIKYEALPHGVQLDLDEKYAEEHSLLIKNADGDPYSITELWFRGSTLPDFSNPETKKWWFDKRRYLVEELGVAGFKTDGGEFLFDMDAVFSDGRRGLEGHNDFPNLYEAAYHTFLEPYGGITFSRAGFAGAQKYPIHWAGDQISDFHELRAQLTAGLSLGLSGVPFFGYDIGGFAGDFPTTELYLRSAALAAFTPIMQFHSEPRGGQYTMTARKHRNNDRSPWNMAVANADESIVPIYRFFANLRMQLLPYIWSEAKHCSETSRPLMAHLLYDFAGDTKVLDIEDEYLFGRNLLVAPLVYEGMLSREIYLPQGEWFDFWTGESLSGGTAISYPCDLTRIPVFLRGGTVLPVNLSRRLALGDGVGNNLAQYERLCLLLSGERGEGAFCDELGNDVHISWTGKDMEVTGDNTADIYVARFNSVERGEVDIFGRKVSFVRKSGV